MAVAIDDVIWCYRSILGREPESADAAQRHADTAKDLRSLVLGFLGSSEYVAKRPSVSWVPLDRPELPIELDPSPQQLSMIKSRIREAWTHLGETRPHYSVLTGKNFLPEVIDERAINLFYASGRQEAARVENVLKRHGFAQPETKVCVEYGCGLGRVTLALAKTFRTVHGYDISPTHLAAAQQRATDAGVANVEFHLCSAERDGEALEPCDFFFSRFVFQHNPPPIIRELIAASLTSLRPGGIAIFQVPTYGTGYSFHIEKYLARAQKLDMELHCIPQAEVLALIADANCRLLEIREDGSVGLLGKWISNTFVVRRPA